MSDVLHLRFLGVGNAAAHELGNAAAVLEDDVGAPLLLIDCGPTVLPGYVDQYATLPEALFITHTHLDHVGGLENLFYRLACEQTALPPVRLYVPAAIVERLHRLLGEEPFKLAEGGMNFWDRFQLVPVGDHFWHAGRLFDVFTVDHHGYRSAFGLALADYFLYTGDTRPIADVLAPPANACFTTARWTATPRTPASTTSSAAIRTNCVNASCSTTTSRSWPRRNCVAMATRSQCVAGGTSSTRFGPICGAPADVAEARDFQHPAG